MSDDHRPEHGELGDGELGDGELGDGELGDGELSDGVASIDEVDVVKALRAALHPPRVEAHKTQRAVQKKLRDASQGRFFADGWSTAHAPLATFLVTSVIMLVLVAITWLLLWPTELELLR